MPPKRKAEPEQEVEDPPVHQGDGLERRAPVVYTGREQAEVLAPPPGNLMQDPLLGASSPPRKVRKVGCSGSSELLLFGSSEDQSMDELGSADAEETESDSSEAANDPDYSDLAWLSENPSSGPTNKAFSTAQEQDKLMEDLALLGVTPFYSMLCSIAHHVRFNIPDAVPSFFAACERVLEVLPEPSESRLERLSEFKHFPGVEGFLNSVSSHFSSPIKDFRFAVTFATQSLLEYLESDEVTTSEGLRRDKPGYRHGMTSLLTVNGFTPPPLESEAVAATPETLESSFILHLDSPECSWCPDPQHWKAHQESEKKRIEAVWDVPLTAMISTEGTLFHALYSIEEPITKEKVGQVMRQFEEKKGLWSSTLKTEVVWEQKKPSQFDESVLYQAVLRLFQFDVQMPNPLAHTDSLSEGFFHDLINTTWITSSFLDPNLATGHGSFQPMVGEKSSKSSKNRRMLQQAPGREQQGRKVDIFAQIPVYSEMCYSELFFVEEKPITSKTLEKKDFLKLSKVMLDGFGCTAYKWFSYCKPPADAVVFGMQIVGLEVTILRMDATYKEVTNLHKLDKSIVFTKDPCISLKAVVKAVASMALINRQLRKYAQTVAKAVEFSKGKPVDNPSDQVERSLSSKTPDKRPRPASKSGGSQTKKATEGGNSDADLDCLPITDLRDLPAGTLVDRFIIGRMIEKGDSSGCWIATGKDTSNGQDVILKLLYHPSDFKHEIQEEMSNHQLAMSSGVPHIIPLLGFVICTQYAGWPRASLYVGMAFPVAIPLSEAYLDMTLEDIVGVVTNIGEALKGLHAIHLIHYDVSPFNIVLDPITHQAMLIDFGHSLLTHPLSRIPFDNGTECFCAPESLRGEWCTPRSDLYSLGVTLLYLITPHLFPEVDKQSLKQGWERGHLRPGNKNEAFGAAAEASSAASSSPLLQALCKCLQRMMSEDPLERPYLQDDLETDKLMRATPRLDGGP